MKKNTEQVSPAELHLTHPKYRPDIDGLRAIAVLSVVLYHAFPSLIRGGFVGVDIFFVISGFLISTIIISNLENNRFSFTEFYARRVKRIFPALLLVLISSYVAGWHILFADEYKQLGKHIAGGAGFISNFLLWDESGYFDTTAEIKPLLHLWSLGIEEQFYIFWPLILWAAWKVRLNLLTLTILFFSISLVWNIEHIASDPVSTFYLPAARSWELLAGCILAYLTLHPGKWPTKLTRHLQPLLGKIIYAPNVTPPGTTLRDVQSILGAMLLLTGFCFTTSKSAFPGWWALLPTTGAVLIISAGSAAWFNRTILASRLFVWIGLISFPLYLWHWPLLTFARIVESQEPAPQIRIAAVAASVILAWLTYRVVERPLRSGDSAFKTPILLALMVLVGIAGYVTYHRDGLSFRPNIRSAERINSQFVGPIWKYTQNKTCLDKYPFKDADNYSYWFCMASSEAAPTVLLIGNSYANQIYSGFVDHPVLNKNSILSIGDCDLARGSEGPAIPGNKTPCIGDGPARQLELIERIVSKNDSIEYVIIDGLSYTPNAEYIANLEKLVSTYASHNKKIIIFHPHFRLDYDIKACFARPLKAPQKNCEMPVEAAEKLRTSFAPLIAAITAKHPAVKFFDQNQLFCDGKKCSMIKDGMPLYRDEYHHLSIFGSGELGKIFAVWAEHNAPGILKN